MGTTGFGRPLTDVIDCHGEQTGCVMRDREAEMRKMEYMTGELNDKAFVIGEWRRVAGFAICRQMPRTNRPVRSPCTLWSLEVQDHEAPILHEIYGMTILFQM